MSVSCASWCWVSGGCLCVTSFASWFCCLLVTFCVCSPFPSAVLFSFSEHQLRTHFTQLLSALSYLHSHRVGVLWTLHPEYICFDGYNGLYLRSWALGALAEAGGCVMDSQGWVEVPYCAPEIVAILHTQRAAVGLDVPMDPIRAASACDGAQADVWSAGIIMMEYILGSACPWAPPLEGSGGGIALEGSVGWIGMYKDMRALFTVLLGLWNTFDAAEDIGVAASAMAVERMDIVEVCMGG